MNPLIPTEEELETKRRPADFKNWLLQNFALWKATPEGRLFLDGENRILKRMKEEIFPLVCYAVRKYPKNDILICPKNRCGEYDAEIFSLDGKEILERVEITIAYNGKKGVFIKQHLKRHGVAPVISDKDFQKSLDVGGVEQAYCYRNELVEDELNRIKEAVERKSRKKYPVDITLLVVYHCNASLVIIDDWVVEQLKGFVRQFTIYKHKFRKMVFIDRTDTNEPIEI